MPTPASTSASGAPPVPDAPVPVRRVGSRSVAPALVFLGRRLLSGAVVLLGATFVVHLLLTSALDPLADLRTSTAPNREALIAARVAALDLDHPPLVRYLDWLRGVLTGDLGTSWVTGQPVASLLGTAIPSTLRLVGVATVVAIGLGVLVGIVSALRQYTGFDHAVTVLSFVLYSLPTFWVAVLLKLWGAIGFNDFLADPRVPPGWTAVVAVASGVVWSAVLGGGRRTRWVAFGAGAVATALVLVLVSTTGWLRDPGLGVAGVAALGTGLAVGVVALTTGLRDRRALSAALATVALGAALHLPLQYAFVHASTPLIALLAAAAVLTGAAIGAALGGADRRGAARAAAVTALGVGLLIYADRLMGAWRVYAGAPQIGGRPIATIGPRTPGLSGDYWVEQLDTLTHLVLPATTLILISFASYTRYARAGLLEVLEQDHVRTARAKGLPERVVVLRHAVRSALVPLATVVPVDLAALFGGAVVIERIFGWSGMGRLFVTSLQAQDIDPVMGYVLVTGALLVLANVLVDVLYAALDPRVRVAG
jgi:peptide/nickel transport system permease protein